MITTQQIATELQARGLGWTSRLGPVCAMSMAMAGAVSWTACSGYAALANRKGVTLAAIGSAIESKVKMGDVTAWDAIVNAPDV